MVRGLRQLWHGGLQGSGLRVQGAGCRVQGAGCRVQGAGFRVQGAGCRVQGTEGVGGGRPRGRSAPPRAEGPNAYTKKLSIKNFMAMKFTAQF